MAQLRRWLPRFAFESIITIFSILVALALNEWRDERQDQARVREARAELASEIRANRTLLTSPFYLPYHRGMQRAYGAARGAHDRATFARLTSEFTTGIHPTPFRDAAWRSLATSGILGRMDYHDVVQLADVYRAQEDVDRINERYLAIVTDPRVNQLPVRLQLTHTRAYANDLASAEQRLLGDYDAVLLRLGRP